jgi:hypothetical protein
LDYICRCSWSSFRASLAKAGSYSGNLVADFSAGNGGAVDAVVKQANVGSGGKVTQIPIMLFRLRVDLVWVGTFVEFFSELSGGVGLKSLLETTYNTSSLD